ncbi:MAG: hypothetical protein U0350_25055 [Caldilineaceae bacterium]
MRLELANQAADATYPAIAFHLRTCPACKAAYWREFDVQGMAKSLPELQQIGQRAAVAEVLDKIVNPPSDIWSLVVEEPSPVAGKLWRLLVEIPLLVKERLLVFGQLPALLNPQLTLAPVLRSKNAPPEREQAAIELLTLPNPEADLLIKLSTGAVINHKSTLIVQLETMAHQPIAQVRTSLRNQHGSLLEQRATDADGLVLFGELEPAKYNIQIKHAGQTWEFSVVLAESR